MKLPIPDDWDGQSWQCFTVYWPDSTIWQALLTGLLSMPGAGRFWDERSGSIIAAQAIGRQIWERNQPLVECSGGENPPLEPEIITRFIHLFGDESEDEMPGPYKVFIDYDTCELVVDYGGCDGECRFDLSCVATSGQSGMPDDYTPPGGGTGGDEYSACGKAYAAVRAVMRLTESIFAHCDDITLTPWADIQTENPGIDIDKSPSGWAAMAYALELKVIGLEWADQEELEQNYLCQAVNAFTDTAADDLANDSNWDLFRSVFRGSALGNYLWGSLYDYVIGGGFSGGPGVLGREQISAIARANAGDTTRDCACPEAPDPELPEGYNWVYSLDFTTGLHQWTLTGDGGETQDETGVYDSTPGGLPWNYVAFQVKRDPENADETTVLKYAKVWFTAGVHWNRDGNADFLQYTGTTPATRILPMTLIAEDYEGGSASRLWTSEVGVVLGPSGGEFLKMNIGGYDNNPITTTLKITRLVIAGDGALPFPLI